MKWAASNTGLCHWTTDGIKGVCGTPVWWEPDNAEQVEHLACFRCLRWLNRRGGPTA